MSKADWGFLERLLEEGQEYSTGISRVWLTVLFLFRILVLGTAAESAWDDEQSDFFCNTAQPGCESVCYDKAFPISHFRYFVLQVIFVSTPTVFYFGYIALRNRKLEEEKEGIVVKVLDGGDSDKTMMDDKKSEKEDLKGKLVIPEGTKLKGSLLCAYTASICVKLLLEVGFMFGMWILYGFIILPKFVCQREPCPHLVDCFVSRPTEKTIFTIYMQVIAAISVLLNVIELLYLLRRALIHYLERKYHGNVQERIRANSTPSGLQGPESFAPAYQDQSNLPVAIHRAAFPEPYKEYPPMETWAIPNQGMNQNQPATSLPSYSNCKSPGYSSTTKSSSERSPQKGHAKSSGRDKLRPRQYV